MYHCMCLVHLCALYYDFGISYRLITQLGVVIEHRLALKSEWPPHSLLRVQSVSIHHKENLQISLFYNVIVTLGGGARKVMFGLRDKRNNLNQPFVSTLVHSAPISMS